MLSEFPGYCKNKREIKIWDISGCSVRAFFEKFYSMEHWGIKFMSKASVIYLRNSIIRGMIEDIQDYGFCVIHKVSSKSGCSVGLLVDKVKGRKTITNTLGATK